MNDRNTPALPAKPIVLVPACNRDIGEHPFHVAGKKYVDAVRLAGCTPLIVPTALRRNWTRCWRWPTACC